MSPAAGQLSVSASAGPASNPSGIAISSNRLMKSPLAIRVSARDVVKIAPERVRRTHQQTSGKLGRDEHDLDPIGDRKAGRPRQHEAHAQCQGERQVVPDLLDRLFEYIFE